jgi:pimeloyl-ACP methyl ester carboxylesterase
LVLLHSYLGGSAIWTDQLAKFSRDHDVISPDLVGLGDSAELTAPNSIEGHACCVLELLDSLGVSEFDLLGHSMGGTISQEMVRLAPDRVRNLVLYGTGPQGLLPGRFETIAQSRALFLKDGISITARKIAASWFLKGEEAEVFPLCQKLGEQASMQAVLARASGVHLNPYPAA